MYARPTHPPLSRANSSYNHNATHVRSLWKNFEQRWAEPQYAAMVKKKADALSQEDKRWATKKSRVTIAEHKARKEKIQRDIEKAHYTAVFEEWQRILKAAGLDHDAWGDMTTAELQTCAKVLGDHLNREEGSDEEEDEEEDEELRSQHMNATASYVQSQLQASTSSLQQPAAMSAASRSANVSSNSYEFVNPNMFGSDDDDGLLFRRHQPVSKDTDDEDIGIPISAGSATDTSGYTTTSSMEFSFAGSTQSSATGSPEVGGNSLPATVPAAASSSSTSYAKYHSKTYSTSDAKASSEKGKAPVPSSLLHSRLPSVSSDTNISEKGKEKGKEKSRVSGPTYIGPILASSPSSSPPPSSELEEMEFKKFKMSIRVQKIIEFHQEAARADIKLALEIHDIHRRGDDRTHSGREKMAEEQVRRVKEHEARMKDLQAAKELERRVMVDEERERMRVEIRARGAKGKGKQNQKQKQKEEVKMFESDVFESDLEGAFEHGVIMGAEGLTLPLPLTSASSASAWTASSPTEEHFYPSSSFSSFEEHATWEPPKSKSSTGMQTRNRNMYVPPVRDDSDDEGDGEGIPSEVMAAIALGGGLDAFLGGSSSEASAFGPGPGYRQQQQEDSWERQGGVGVAAAWAGKMMPQTQGQSREEGVWNKSKAQVQSHQESEGMWAKAKHMFSPPTEHHQEQQEQLRHLLSQPHQQQQQQESLWAAAKKTPSPQQQQQESLWAAKKAPSPTGLFGEKRAVPPTSATPVQSGWKKSGSAAAPSATPVQSGWSKKTEGKGTPSLFAEGVASKLGNGMKKVDSAFSSTFGNAPLLKKGGSLLVDEVAPVATPSVPVPVGNKKMTKKQRQQSQKLFGDEFGGDDGEEEGYKSSEISSTPRPSKNPFEHWEEGPSTPRPFQTRGLSHVQELSGRPEPTHRSSGLRNEIPISASSKAAKESESDFWMPGAAKWGEDEPGMWAPAGAAAGGRQYWNAPGKEKQQTQTQTPQAQGGLRAGRKSAFDSPAMESATPGSMLRKGGKVAKGKKPVMVEEVRDEEEEELEYIEKLPSDSRFIMEPKQPKPQAPPTAFDNIISYNGGAEEEEDEEDEYDDMGWSSGAPTPSTARTSPPEAFDVGGLDIDPDWLAKASMNLQSSNKKMEKIFGDIPSGPLKGTQQTRWGSSLGHNNDSSSSSSASSSPFFTDTEMCKSSFDTLGTKKPVPVKAPEPPKIPTPPKAAPKVSPAPPAPAPAAPPAAPPKSAAQASTLIEKAKTPVKPELEPKKNNKSSKAKGKGRR